MTERDRQNSSLRTHEGDLHAMEKKENALSNQIRDKDNMEERIVVMTNEISSLSAKLKVPSFLSSDVSQADGDSLGIGRETCGGTGSYSAPGTGTPTGAGGVECEGGRGAKVDTGNEYER